MNHRTQLIGLLLVLVTAAYAAGADARPVVGTAKGSLELELDRANWSAIEPITGKIIFKVSEVRDRSGRLLDAVRLNDPKLEIAFPAEMAAAMPQVRWRSVFFPTIKVGRSYEMHFSIRLDEEFAKLLTTKDEPDVLFNAGKYQLSAMVASSPRPSWEAASKSLFVELHQQFTSTPKEITIVAARSGRVIDGEMVKRLLDEAQGPLKHQIITFYAKRKVLSREDVLAGMEAATGSAKADLAGLYLSLGHAAEDLKFFAPIAAPVKLKGHGAEPMFLLARPQQRIRFESDLSEMHRLRVGELDTVLTTKKVVDFTAPSAAGIYEMYDDHHKKPWGWMLVVKDQERIAAAGLRPDTTELSKKVAQAIFKQDAKALAALAAPGFDAEETIRKLRFKLAQGDIRYHESTGTSRKVKTRMKVNAAEPGKEPVFFRELVLHYVLVGDELKLEQAAVWDAEN